MTTGYYHHYFSKKGKVNGITQYKNTLITNTVKSRALVSNTSIIILHLHRPVDSKIPTRVKNLVNIKTKLFETPVAFLFYTRTEPSSTKETETHRKLSIPDRNAGPFPIRNIKAWLLKWNFRSKL